MGSVGSLLKGYHSRRVLYATTVTPALGIEDISVVSLYKPDMGPTLQSCESRLGMIGMLSGMALKIGNS